MDAFSSPQAIYFSGDWSGSQQASYITGGQRDVSVDVSGPMLPDSVVGLVGHDPTPGYNLNALQVGTAGESPAVVTLQYSGVHTGTDNAYALGGAPGVGYDLTGNGKFDSFALRFQSLDSILEVTFTITTPVGSTPGADTSTLTEFVPPSSSPFNFNIPFAFLVGNASPSSSDSVTITFNGNKQPNIDYEVALNVPEPPALALILTGIVALCGLGLCGSRGQAGKAARSADDVEQ